MESPDLQTRGLAASQGRGVPQGETRQGRDPAAQLTPRAGSPPPQAQAHVAVVSPGAADAGEATGGSLHLAATLHTEHKQLANPLLSVPAGKPPDGTRGVTRYFRAGVSVTSPLGPWRPRHPVRPRPPAS